MAPNHLASWFSACAIPHPLSMAWNEWLIFNELGMECHYTKTVMQNLLILAIFEGSRMPSWELSYGKAWIQMAWIWGRPAAKDQWGPEALSPIAWEELDPSCHHMSELEADPPTVEPSEGTAAQMTFWWQLCERDVKRRLPTKLHQDMW